MCGNTMKRRELLKIKREVQNALFCSVFSAKEQIYGEIEYINSRIWKVKEEVCCVLDKCKNIDELLNITDFTLTDAINDIIANFGNLLTNVEKKYHDDVIHTGEIIFNKYGIKGLNSDCIDLCKFELTKDDKDWIIKESDNLIYETVREAIDYIIEDAQGYSNSACSFDHKITEYKKWAKQIISGGMDYLVENLLRKVIEYYIVELVNNIKITKKSFDLLIDRNADLPKQFCDSKVEIKDDTNEEKRYIIDIEKYICNVDNEEYSSINRKDTHNSDSNVCYQANRESFLSNDFFPSGISVDEGSIFPMVVMATMSSGKSTLINALLGGQVLPSKNEACTAKKYMILDDDQSDGTTIYITYKNGQTLIEKENISEELERANNNEEVVEVLIKDDIKGVLNTDRALLVVDTPGPNNSRDKSHEKVMEDVISKVKGGLFLYVMNATQMGINDDKYLLWKIREQITENPKISLIFVLNKVDQLDEDRGESIEQFVSIAKEYLLSNGIEKPYIIPVSALSASLFKKVLNGVELTRNEYRSFCDCYDVYQPKDYSMRSFAITDTLKNQNDKVQVRGTEYMIRDLNRAIDNTGIRLLEEEIQKAQILSSGIIKNTVNVCGGK